MEKIYRVKEFARMVGKSPSTVRRWDREGRLVSKRSIGGHRYYDENDVKKALGIEISREDKKIIVYCRVSSNGQKKDLESQVKSMEEFCLGSGIAVNEWIEEIGGGMNFKRKKFISIIKRIEEGEISKIIIAHKDRLVRFGFDFFNMFFNQHGCDVIVVNQDRLSPQQEMVEDLMSIIHCFSCRLYGLRNYKKKIKEMAELSNEQCDKNNL